MSDLSPPELAQLTELWQLTNVTKLDETPRAWLYQVQTQSAEPAALKILKPAGISSEGQQAELLRIWNGKGAVHCYASHGHNYLMEWLDGPSLGDLSRNGDDDDAASIIAQVARKLQHAPGDTAVMTLVEYAEELTILDPSRIPADDRALFIQAQNLLSQLLATQPKPCLLHGDLHHDNIRQSPRGWLAFDPKGAVGDPHYEFANSFQNPVGMGHLALNHDRANRLADIYGGETGLDRQRLLDWAGVHAALSLCWSLKDPEPFWHNLPIVRSMMALTQ